MRKLIMICFVMAIFVTTASAQEKPIRIGLKFGVPNIAGLNAEYVTPKQFAPTLDFSYFSLSIGGADASFSYIELGSNYYFKPEGKGFYGHLSYGRLGLKASYDDATAGKGEGKIGLNLVNLKIGAKLGNAFYFRPEIGYGLLLGGAKYDVEYPDGTTEEKTAPGALAGGFIGNLGFGVAF